MVCSNLPEEADNSLSSSAHRMLYSPLICEDRHNIQRCYHCHRKSVCISFPCSILFAFYIKLCSQYWNRHYVLQKYHCNMAKMPWLEIECLLRLILPKEQISNTITFILKKKNVLEKMSWSLSPLWTLRYPSCDFLLEERCRPWK